MGLELALGPQGPCRPGPPCWCFAVSSHFIPRRAVGSVAKAFCGSPVPSGNVRVPDHGQHPVVNTLCLQPPPNLPIPATPPDTSFTPGQVVRV